MRLRIKHEENGSALLMGAVCIWFILYALVMIIEVSESVKTKMKLQMAADTAALSGARIMANSISTIAWINDARAILYYKQCRYAADLWTMGMMARVYLQIPMNSDGELLKDELLPDSKIKPNFYSDFMETWENYTQKNNVDWMWEPDIYPDRAAVSAEGDKLRLVGMNEREQLARLQYSLSLIADTLVEKEVYDRASDNGSQSTCFFPTIPLVPKTGWKQEIIITKIDEPNEIGWNFLFDDGRYVEARMIGTNQWFIDFNGERTALVEKINGSRAKIRHCDLTGSSENCDETFIDRDAGVVMSGGRAVSSVTLDDGSREICKIENFQMPTWEQYDENYELPNFEYGKCYRYKFEDQNLYEWNYASDKWEEVPLPENIDPSGESWVNSEYGTRLRVTQLPYIDIAEGFYLYTNSLVFHGISLSFTNPMKVQFWMDGNWINAENDFASVNGLSTRSADCKWKRWNRWRARRDDRRRHRICFEESNVWRYEYEELPTYLTQEYDQNRFAIQQGRVGVTGSDQASQYWEKEWFDVEKGTLMANLEQPSFSRPCWNPEDMDCQYVGVDHDKSVCTPVPGVANGWFHVKNASRPVLIPCNLCRDTKGHVYSLISDADNGADGLGDFDPQDTGPHKDVYDVMLKIKEVLDFTNSSEILKRMTPVVLTEEFFKYGITVGTWSSGANNILERATDSKELLADGKLFNRSQNGLFAFASARVGFYDDTIGRYRFNFTDDEDRVAWLESKDNLYITDWKAYLFPINRQIKTEDIDASEYDSGMTYLMRFMADTEWRATYFSRGRNKGHQLRSIRRFNYDDDAIKDLILH